MNNNAFKPRHVEFFMKKEFAILFLMILISGFVLADNNCVPNLKTNEFYGKVYVNSNPLTNGDYVLVATINNVIVGAQRIGSDGSYSIDVSPCSSVTSGKIYFYVGDVMVEESGQYNYDSTAPILIPLDLTLKKYPNSVCGNGELNKGEECDDENSEDRDGCSSICEVELGYECVWSVTKSICTVKEYCGDGICNNQETCSSCANDCGQCSSGETGGNTGGGGGGSSGGGSSGGSSRSSGSVSLSTSSNNNADDSSDEVSSIEDLNKEKETSSQQGFFNFLTGFVTGAGEFVSSTLGIVVIIFVVLVVGLFIALRFLKIKKPKKK